MHRMPDSVKYATVKRSDSSYYSYAGMQSDIKSILAAINISYTDSAKTELTKMSRAAKSANVNKHRS